MGKTHLEKRLQLGQLYRQYYWLIGRRSKLSLANKVLIYKTIIRSVWAYGIQLWGSASNSNILKIQRFQSKVLRAAANAPWYVTNAALHKDLQVQTVVEECTKLSDKYHTRLSVHPNELAADLLIAQSRQRLKEYDPLDLSANYVLKCT